MPASFQEATKRSRSPRQAVSIGSWSPTELAERFPIHVDCEWIGNSQAVATKHYLQTTDEHFAKAIKEEPGALHEAVQQTSASAGNDMNESDDFVGQTAETLHSRELELARQDLNLE